MFPAGISLFLWIDLLIVLDIFPFFGLTWYCMKGWQKSRRWLLYSKCMGKSQAQISVDVMFCVLVYFIRVSTKRDLNSKMYTVPTLILQLKNSTAWKIIWRFQHGLVTLLVRLWQHSLMVSPTGGADIPGALVHPTALPVPGLILPENYGCKSHQLSENRACSAHSYIHCVKMHAEHSTTISLLFWWCEMILSAVYLWLLLIAWLFF